MRHIYLDYNSISIKLDALAGKIQRDGYEALVAILRGGSFSGVHLAFLTGLPIYFLSFNRTLEKASWFGPSPKQKNLLLCEDFAGSGKTLIKSKQFILDEGYKVSTCVVCVDKLSASMPDYTCFSFQNEDVRVILPWERYRVNHAVDTNPNLTDLEYEKTAWDLDGIFLNDISGEHYTANLESALLMRDQLLPVDDAPQVNPGDCIITGRPTQDENRTQQWLKKHGIHAPVYFRNDAIEWPTSQSTAHWKAQKALELGCTHFVESDAAQAAIIASVCPELRVVWWNSGDPIALQAAGTTLYRHHSK